MALSPLKGSNMMIVVNKTPFNIEWVFVRVGSLATY